MRAVNVEPVLADKVGLVEQCAVGAEEAVLGEAAGSVTSADVEGLALSLGVRVVASIGLAVAEEGCIGDLGEDRVVVPGDAWDDLLQVVSASSTTSVL